MKSLVVLCFILFNFFCSDKLQSDIQKLIEDKNYIALAILCSEIQENVFEKECSLGMKKSEEEISDIVNGLKDLPFSKVHVEQNKRKLIEVLFKKNTHLQIKYSQIWKESVYEN